jgi:hypothetical protein
MTKWRGVTTVQPVRKMDLNGAVNAPGSQDIAWTIQHVSAPIR